MTTKTREEELLELINEQLKEIDLGFFQPPEDFVVMSLDSFGYHTETGVPPLRDYRERKKGCALHGYEFGGLDKRNRFFCKECARERARINMRRLRAQRKGKEVTGSVSA